MARPNPPDRSRRSVALVVSECLAGACLAVLILMSGARLEVKAALAAALFAVAALASIATVGWPRDRSQRNARTNALLGTLDIALGSTAFAAGAGAGIPNLVLAGPSLVAVIGLVAAVAGLVTTIAGFGRVLGPLPRLARLVGIPGAFVVAQFWILPVLAAAIATTAATPWSGGTPPAGAKTVSFDAGDGTRLAAWYTPSKNGATVIVLPGAGGTKADTQAQTNVLTKHDFGVLAVDPRGSGESRGGPMLYGWGGDSDLRAAVDFLTSQPALDNSRIAALGLSMGGEVALTGTAADPRIKAVVAEGATARTCTDQTFLPPGAGGAIHHFDSCTSWFLSGLLSGSNEPAPLTDQIRQIGSRPVLLIAADLAEEHAATEAMRAVAPSTVELWEPANARHTGALAAHPADWERKVVAFLAAALRVPG